MFTISDFFMTSCLMSYFIIARDLKQVDTINVMDFMVTQSFYPRRESPQLTHMCMANETASISHDVNVNLTHQTCPDYEMKAPSGLSIEEMTEIVEMAEINKQKIFLEAPPPTISQGKNVQEYFNCGYVRLFSGGFHVQWCCHQSNMAMATTPKCWDITNSCYEILDIDSSKNTICCRNKGESLCETTYKSHAAFSA